MNKARRKGLDTISEGIENLKGELDMLMEEEQEYLDNMPESLQSGERYEVAEEAISNMESAISGLDEVIDSIASASG